MPPPRPGRLLPRSGTCAALGSSGGSGSARGDRDVIAVDAGLVSQYDPSIRPPVAISGWELAADLTRSAGRQTRPCGPWWRQATVRPAGGRSGPAARGRASLARGPVVVGLGRSARLIRRRVPAFLLPGHADRWPMPRSVGLLAEAGPAAGALSSSGWPSCEPPVTVLWLAELNAISFTDPHRRPGRTPARAGSEQGHERSYRGTGTGAALRPPRRACACCAPRRGWRDGRLAGRLAGSR